MSDQSAEAATKVKKRYQDIDGPGSGTSKSHQKLRALRLGRLRGATQRQQAPLSGLSVLDLGCNEGFFCAEAVRQGASRVVGIDRRKDLIASARENCPEATFIHGSWWDLPDEEFDVVLFLSAIHYEQDQKKLLTRILQRLTPIGTLVLECGVFSDSKTPERWGFAKRQDGFLRYPTDDLLINDLLADYAVSNVGKSVAQGGDPVPRFVFHCNRPSPSVLLIAGSSLAGKTYLSAHLHAGGIRRYSIDHLLLRLLTDDGYQSRHIAKVLRTTANPKNREFGWLGREIAADRELTEDLCKAILDEAPTFSCARPRAQREVKSDSCPIGRGSIARSSTSPAQRPFTSRTPPASRRARPRPRPRTWTVSRTLPGAPGTGAR